MAWSDRCHCGPCGSKRRANRGKCSFASVGAYCFNYDSSQGSKLGVSLVGGTRRTNRRPEIASAMAESDQSPEDGSAALRAALLLDRYDREKDAVRYYRRALESDISIQDEKLALVCLASSHRNLRELSDAMTVILKARRKFPKDPVVESFYALILFDQGQARKAMRILGMSLVDCCRPGLIDSYEPILRAKFAGISTRK